MQPNLSLVGSLRAQAVSSDQWVRKTPDSTLELAEGLGEPSRESQIVKINKESAILFPQQVESGFRLSWHWRECCAFWCGLSSGMHEGEG